MQISHPFSEASTKHAYHQVNRVRNTERSSPSHVSFFFINYGECHLLVPFALQADWLSGSELSLCHAGTCCTVEGAVGLLHFHALRNSHASCHFSIAIHQIQP